MMAAMINFHSLFSKAVLKFGTHKAILFSNDIRNGNEVLSLNYLEAASLVNQISVWLENSLPSEERGIFCFCNPSLLLPVLLLGITKLGIYFVCVDLINSFECMDKVRKKMPVKFIIGSADTFKEHEDKNQMPLKLNETSRLETVAGTILLKSLEETDMGIKPDPSPSIIAYLVLTSGTTGSPKVVKVSHQSIISNILCLQKRLEITEKDVIPLLAPTTFDPSMIDIFLPLASGAALAIVKDQIKQRPLQLLQILRTFKASAIQITPSVLYRYKKEDLSSFFDLSTNVRLVVLGGEPCPPPEVISSWKAEGNKTIFYNIYGITEVSCWSTLVEANLLEGSDIPLGDVLEETLLQIRDIKDECIIDQENGEGQLFIGSLTRLCFLNDEPVVFKRNEILWRSTGDWVEVRNGQIYFRHRLDDIVKHNGKKLSLASIREGLRELDIAQSYAVLYCSKRKVVLSFIVLHHRSTELNKTRALIINIIGKCCSCPVPIEVCFLPELPVTNHGKINSKFLLGLSCIKVKDVGFCATLSPPELFLKLLKNRSHSELTLSKNGKLCDYGFDSVTTVQFALDMEWHLNRFLPLLLEKLLHENLQHIIDYLNDDTNLSETEKNVKNFISDQDSVKTKSEVLSFVKKPTTSKCFRCSGRAIQTMVCHCGQCLVIPEDFKSSDITVREEWSLEEEWTHCLSKCIDATPLLISYKEGSCIVFIGAHSGKFVALDFNTGQAFWTLLLGDRIEGSACLAEKTESVLFGCYNGILYCVSILEGTTTWKVQTEAEIKTTPVVDITRDIVFCGSHDRSLYIISIHTGEIMKRLDLWNGSLFAQPAMNYSEPCHLYVASLDGTLTAFNKNFCIEWNIKIGKPIFSSPLCFLHGVCISSVDNNIYFYDHKGILKWTFACKGPVFCSPSKFSSSIIFGSHDHNVYCLNSLNGELKWIFEMDSPVYSTPAAFLVENQVYCAVASSNGTLTILSIKLKNVKVMLSKKLQGQIFGSPIVQNGNLLIGCRNDLLYKFKMSTG